MARKHKPDPAALPPDTPPVGLGDLRRQIDDLDTQIVEFLNRRAGIVVEIGKLKQTSHTPVYAPDREKEVLERICKANTGPLSAKTLQAIYRELMSGSFALEKPLRIAYLGPQGTFSHSAAMAKFGSSVEYEAVLDIPSVFNEVCRGHVDFGVVPIENSVHGGVIDTLDAFVQSDVRICAELNLAVHHNLLAKCPLDAVQKVYSKPEVFSQCARWLGQTGLVGKTIAVASSSRAAELAAVEPGAAALASTLAAEIYGLQIICPNVEDIAGNVTRFFIIATHSAKRTGDDKTAIMFTTQHKAGALVDVLNVFRAAGINLTMITSRPSKRRNWEYYFFVDAEGHTDDASLVQAIHEAKNHCLELHVLGSFPKAKEIL